jgi:hypothetical protein
MVASRAEGTNAAWIQEMGRRSKGDLGPGCGEEEEKGKKVLTLFFFTKFTVPSNGQPQVGPRRQ